MKAAYSLMSLWEMLQLPIGQLLSSLEGISKFTQATEGLLRERRPMKMSPMAHSSLRRDLEAFHDGAKTTGLLVTAGIAGKARDHFMEAGVSGEARILSLEDLEQFRHLLDSMMECLEQEAAVTVAMILPPEMACMFEATTPIFGVDVAAKFPGIQYDTSETGKCLALGRSTAAVFHSMRCLEAGISAISRCLAIPDPTKGADRNWGALLGKIKTAIDGRWVGSASRMGGDGEFFEGLYAVLVALRNPYRNATMHLDQKFTEDESKHLTEMVKGVMQKIASRMDENGLPLA